jgi:hypothetical protein
VIHPTELKLFSMSLVISPAGKAISKEELVKHFNYPDVDLSDIDDEWI